MGRQEKQRVGYSQFACIGSGFSAVGLGATLKRWYGITDIHFFERHSDLGGTWFANTYPDAPGCACDVPSLLYSFSFAPNPRWTRVLASSGELLEYLKHVADDYDLPSKMTFGAEVKRCEWLQHSQRWRIHFRNVDDDTMSVHECQFLFAGTGALVTPRDPDVPGLESFNGPVIHAGRWSSDVELRGKNVVLVGNGCSAAQIVPNIVNETKQLTQFVRSKHWIIPHMNVPTSTTLQWAFEHVPGLLATARFLLFLSAENDLRGFYMTKAGASFRARREAGAARYVRKTAPAKYHHLLIPDYEIGCKRRIFDPGYLKALHATNLNVTDDPITQVLPDAVRSKSGATTKADIIVLATGYSTNSFMAGIEVVGRNGVTMDQHWESFDGPEAYNGCALNEFPNFFMLLGPNTVTGHTSAIMAIENAINYALRVIKPVIDGDATTAEVKREAEIQYSQQMQEDLHKTVWWGGCANWYNTKGRSGKQWNAMTYPHSQMHYWYKCLFPTYGDWNYTRTPNAARRIFLRRTKKLVLWTGLLLVAARISLFVRSKGLEFNNYLPHVLQACQAIQQRLPF
ncbi:Uncharacterized protein TPAR_00120 [Tolypocladium paradoxum]|uniref:Uncharacterized protein n=1 Tax=Tolypocladium paradoxum TaxID=94208 RepID=A0A2S4LBA1_9HYPO|nr:Uncharacterized protein TPAR_00120 [Tolypocladium paradoxum]